MSWKNFWVGVLVAILCGTITTFFLRWYWEAGKITAFLFGLSTFITLVAALGTNFGRGYRMRIGYSHLSREPFIIPPVPRPRLGGFVTGYALVGIVFYCAIICIYIHGRS